MNQWMMRIGMGLGAAVVVGGVGIQLLPYGHDHTNPPVTQEPAWDSPETRALAKRACFDCHSNETTWPWYSNIAPLSWRVVDHVEEGREKMNFSEWDKPQKHADEAAEELEDGEMPLSDYLLLHSEAKLSAAETAALVASFEVMFGREVHEAGAPGGGAQGEGDEGADDDE